MPRGPIRRAQLIAPFGTGALTVVRDGTSLIAAGLDYWFVREGDDGQPVETEEFEFQEWRLQELLQVDHFRLPPDYRKSRNLPGARKTPNCWLTVPFLRFPKWHFCPQCNRLWELTLTAKGRQFCGDCEKKGWKKALAQVPFAAMCDHGHLQDFPWREWVHGSASPQCNLPIRLVATGGSSLAAQVVKCDCGVPDRPLSRITEADPDGSSSYVSKNLDKSRQPFTCRGLMPWLGTDEPTPCDRPLRGTLRSASNIYFADIHSAIYLPRGDGAVPTELVALMESPPLSTLIRALTDAVPVIEAHHLRNRNKQLLKDYSDAQITAALAIAIAPPSQRSEAIAAAVDGDDERTAFRRDEYAVLGTPRSEDQLQSKEAVLGDYEQMIGRNFARIMLVHKLRETRALAGFTRVFPETDKSLAERRAMLRRRQPEEGNSWLPAYTVHGEGIFLELSPERLAHWEAEEGVIRRALRLGQQFQRAQRRRALMARPVSPRFVLLHTLAHLLMNRLTFECGYSSASLRERLYVSDNPLAPMGAILIYTAAGDAEGTMGGLVRMGKAGYFEPILRRALEGAIWCSADPVCMELGESGGQGPDSCNLAACHNCALVPETACEEFNRLLDRGLVVGSLTEPKIGFFSQEVLR